MLVSEGHAFRPAVDTISSFWVANRRGAYYVPVKQLRASTMPRDPSDRPFDAQETQLRFEAALRGARAAEPLPMKDIPPKRRVAKKSKQTLTRTRDDGTENR